MTRRVVASIVSLALACSTTVAAQDWRELYSMAVAAQRELDLEMAEAKLHLALDAAKAGGASAEEVGRILDRLAVVYHDSQRPELAEETLLESLDQKTRRLGERHPAVAATLLLLSDLRFVNGDYEEAGNLLEQAVELRRDAWGPTSPALSEALILLGYFQEGRGSVAAAERSFREALAAVESCHPPPRQRMDALIGLREVLLSQGRTAEAGDLAPRIDRVLDRLPPDDPADVPAHCP